jgi:hypothetical protein
VASVVVRGVRARHTRADRPYGGTACLTTLHSPACRGPDARSPAPDRGGTPIGTPRSARTPLDRRPGALDESLRHAPVARHLQLDRHRRGADRPGQHRRRLAARRVRDPRVGHPEGHRPHRARVRLRAGGRPQPGLRRSGR